MDMESIMDFDQSGHDVAGTVSYMWAMDNLYSITFVI